MKYKYKGVGKVVFSALVLLFIVLIIISSSLSVLKEEATKAHLDIANVHVQTFAEYLNNTIYNIDLLIENLNAILKKGNITQDEYYLLLKNSPYIRSINIVKARKIILSSNPENLKQNIDISNFYPKQLFRKNILRFGRPWSGRDFSDGYEITKDKKIDQLDWTFLPIAKTIFVDNKDYTVLISLNSDFFLTKFANSLNMEMGYVDILDIDGRVLISTDTSLEIGTKVMDSDIFKKSLLSTFASGVENFKGSKNIVSYRFTENYPLSISVRLDYKKSLSDWEDKRFSFLFTITLLLVFIALLILILIVRHNKNREKEILMHKSQLENQKRFKILFEQSSFLASFISADGLLLATNTKAETLTGLDLNSYNGDYFWNLPCFYEDDKRILEEIVKNYKVPKNISREIFLKDKDDNRRIIDFSLTAINFDDKYELIAIGNDITEKKKHEESLKQAYQVFKNTHDGIMITDSQCNMINVNNAFEKSTGYTRLEVLNKNPNILQSGYHSKEFYEKMWNELKSKGYWDGEIVNKKKDGELYNEWLTISAVYDEKDKLINFIGVFSDTTKQKEQEKLIKEKERMLFQQSKMASMGEMLGNIAHQWRQPLNVISVSAGAIKLHYDLKDVYSEKELIDFVNSISNSSRYLSDTIDDFRNFFTKDSRNDEFDILTIVKMTLTLLSSSFKNKEIEIVFRKTENISIYGNENEFKQVIMNIINNAKDALLENNIDNKKFIFIDVYKENQYVKIEILDNAGGINDNIISKVFEPYFTTKHQSQGTGIGLYMTEEIISKHMKGRIKVQNETFEYEENKYHGAKFTITLPEQ